MFLQNCGSLQCEPALCTWINVLLLLLNKAICQCLRLKLHPRHVCVLFVPPGEFGSVMEGLLTQEESVLKVAVKTMKSE